MTLIGRRSTAVVVPTSKGATTTRIPVAMKPAPFIAIAPRSPPPRPNTAASSAMPPTDTSTNAHRIPSKPLVMLRTRAGTHQRFPTRLGVGAVGASTLPRALTNAEIPRRGPDRNHSAPANSGRLLGAAPGRKTEELVRPVVPSADETLAELGRGRCPREDRRRRARPSAPASSSSRAAPAWAGAARPLSDRGASRWRRRACAARPRRARACGRAPSAPRGA